LKEGGVEGPRPRTLMLSRKGKGGDVDVENRKESSDELNEQFNDSISKRVDE
jgi:hypothetical protein